MKRCWPAPRGVGAGQQLTNSQMPLRAIPYHYSFHMQSQACCTSPPGPFCALCSLPWTVPWQVLLKPASCCLHLSTARAGADDYPRPTMPRAMREASGAVAGAVVPASNRVAGVQTGMTDILKTV